MRDQARFSSWRRPWRDHPRHGPGSSPTGSERWSYYASERLARHLERRRRRRPHQPNALHNLDMILWVTGPLSAAASLPIASVGKTHTIRNRRRSLPPSSNSPTAPPATSSPARAKPRHQPFRNRRRPRQAHRRARQAHLLVRTRKSVRESAKKTPTPSPRSKPGKSTSPTKASLPKATN